MIILETPTPVDVILETPAPVEVEVQFPGPRGPQGVPGIGNATIRGEWDPDVAYVVNDIVTYGGELWSALIDTTGQTPGNPPLIWQLLVAKGGDGSGGAGTTQTRETPVGAIDGANLSFGTSAAFVPGSTILYLNGLALSTPDDYAESLFLQIQMVEAPEPGDRLLITYTEA